jgi:hypothetical protein
VLGAARGSFLGGIAGGLASARIVPRVLLQGAVLGAPATACSIVAGGGGGIVSAGLAWVVGTMAGPATEVVREELGKGRAWWVGAAAGICVCYGSKVGAYHWLVLPMILLEMERGDMSVLGALDLCCLAMVGAVSPSCPCSACRSLSLSLSLAPLSFFLPLSTCLPLASAVLHCSATLRQRLRLQPCTAEIPKRLPHADRGQNDIAALGLRSTSDRRSGEKHPLAIRKWRRFSSSALPQSLPEPSGVSSVGFHSHRL